MANLLACPQCKGGLELATHRRICSQCGRSFGLSKHGVWSFMLTTPPFAIPMSQQEWQPTQTHYEEWADEQGDTVPYDEYQRQLNGVSEIYTQVFDLQGSVLDVGAHQGRLRHFLADDATYLAIDPFANPFRGLAKQEALLRAYPCLRNPCNFVQGQAEFLPIESGSFDYVHMRSVLDHFFDPTLALFEARRVLKPRGGLLIGVHVTGGRSAIQAGMLGRVRRKFQEGPKAVVRAVGNRLRGVRDEHLWHPTYDELLELIDFVGLRIEKVHWQKPPNDHVVYVMARRND